MHTPEQIEFGRWLFAQECGFVAGTETLDRVPPANLPEIAFAGRSNVGKSSLVNALTGRKSLARASETPGRTRQLNFFDLGGKLMLVDLPGYGYAKASKTDIAAWTKVVHDYLRGRSTLRRVCLLVDSRHGLKPTDIEVMKLLDESAVTYVITLTKQDKIRPEEAEALRKQIEGSFKKHPAAYPEVFVTSSEKGNGISELRAELSAFVT